MTIPSPRRGASVHLTAAPYLHDITAPTLRRRRCPLAKTRRRPSTTGALRKESQGPTSKSPFPRVRGHWYRHIVLACDGLARATATRPFRGVELVAPVHSRLETENPDSRLGSIRKQSRFDRAPKQVVHRSRQGTPPHVKPPSNESTPKREVPVEPGPEGDTPPGACGTVREISSAGDARHPHRG